MPTKGIFCFANKIFIYTFAPLKGTVAIFGWSRTYLAYYESFINHIKNCPNAYGKKCSRLAAIKGLKVQGVTQ